ncbi:unnamed protein product [Vitrella brassicaformis CCMP3155]|uniref:Protein kinase domain-containing protein n=3 Tax=Vitrella brassicaformis TaxID=1169539 RepID=A0A0G4H666_VITBC|nr:unnamed protein product [Vitrella brassicaformis CCMP3155]|eukprot:CEM39353.1 unnamed protein product [Vitrella brassicaformis CCMP3155]
MHPLPGAPHHVTVTTAAGPSPRLPAVPAYAFHARPVPVRPHHHHPYPPLLALNQATVTPAHASPYASSRRAYYPLSDVDVPLSVSQIGSKEYARRLLRSLLPEFADEPPDTGQVDWKNLTLEDITPIGPQEECLLGKGSFGEVHAIHVKGGNKIYAVKHIRKARALESGDNRSMVAQVEKEISTMQLLDHPNLIKLHKVLEDDFHVYLIMDICGKGELYHRMRTRRPPRFNEDDAFIYFLQVVLALAHMHASGFFHRDLKPENLLIGSDGLIKLVDLGWAAPIERHRLMSGPPTAAGRQRLAVDGLRNTFCGSLDYLAPEMALARPGHDYRVDIWGLGVLLYEFFVGRPPFASMSWEALLLGILNVDYTIPEYVPSDVSDLIKRLVVYNAKQRLELWEIMHHPWVKKHLEKRTKVHPQAHVPRSTVLGTVPPATPAVMHRDAAPPRRRQHDQDTPPDIDGAAPTKHRRKTDAAVGPKRAPLVRVPRETSPPPVENDSGKYAYSDAVYMSPVLRQEERQMEMKKQEAERARRQLPMDPHVPQPRGALAKPLPGAAMHGLPPPPFSPVAVQLHPHPYPPRVPLPVSHSVAQSPLPNPINLYRHVMASPIPIHRTPNIPNMAFQQQQQQKQHHHHQQQQPQPPAKTAVMPTSVRPRISTGMVGGGSQNRVSSQPPPSTAPHGHGHGQGREGRGVGAAAAPAAGAGMHRRDGRGQAANVGRGGRGRGEERPPRGATHHERTRGRQTSPKPPEGTQAKGHGGRRPVLSSQPPPRHHHQPPKKATHPKMNDKGGSPSSSHRNLLAPADGREASHNPPHHRPFVRSSSPFRNQKTTTAPHHPHPPHTQKRAATAKPSPAAAAAAAANPKTLGSGKPSRSTDGLRANRESVTKPADKAAAKGVGKEGGGRGGGPVALRDALGQVGGAEDDTCERGPAPVMNMPSLRPPMTPMLQLGRGRGVGAPLVAPGPPPLMRHGHRPLALGVAGTVTTPTSPAAPRRFVSGSGGDERPGVNTRLVTQPHMPTNLRHRGQGPAFPSPPPGPMYHPAPPAAGVQAVAHSPQLVHRPMPRMPQQHLVRPLTPPPNYPSMYHHPYSSNTGRGRPPLFGRGVGGRG